MNETKSGLDSLLSSPARQTKKGNVQFRLNTISEERIKFNRSSPRKSTKKIRIKDLLKKDSPSTKKEESSQKSPKNQSPSPDFHTVALKAITNPQQTSTSYYNTEVNKLDFFAYDKFFNKVKKVQKPLKKSLDKIVFSKRAKHIFSSPIKGNKSGRESPFEGNMSLLSKIDKYRDLTESKEKYIINTKKIVVKTKHNLFRITGA